MAGRQQLIGSRPSLAPRRPVRTRFCLDSTLYLAITAASRYSRALREVHCTSAQAASSGTNGSGDTHLAENSDSEDAIQLLDEAEALERVEFDPGVDSKDAWDPPKPMTSFLEKHFNRSLSDAEREAIMKDFPKGDQETGHCTSRSSSRPVSEPRIHSSQDGSQRWW